MKKLHLLAIICAIVCSVSCKEEHFETTLLTSLTENSYTFSHTGGEKSFTIECNESWSINEIPEWIEIIIDNDGKIQERYAKGLRNVTLSIAPNDTYELRSTNLTITSESGNAISYNIKQEKKPKLMGYWILSEGYANRNNSELAWYDASKDKLSVKQFIEINGKALGDTGNDLKIYGSKMYCVISGPGMGNENTEGSNYIEVINPADGKSIKRIPFVDAKGAPAKPRKIIFKEGKGYITSYSNEIVRLDTLSLALDAHATLKGSYAEGLCFHDKKIYICNSGQGTDNKISIVDPHTMKEEKIIETEKNPMVIASAGDKGVYFSTNFDKYKVYKLNTATGETEEIKNIRANDLTIIDGTLFSCFLDFKSYMGTTYELDLSTKEATPTHWDIAGAGIRLLMEYHIGKIGETKLIYLTGMGDDIVILNPITKEIMHTFKVKVANGNSVVAYYN